jgi:hypothetical protein
MPMHDITMVIMEIVNIVKKLINIPGFNIFIDATETKSPIIKIKRQYIKSLYNKYLFIEIGADLYIQKPRPSTLTTGSINLAPIADKISPIKKMFR